MKKPFFLIVFSLMLIFSCVNMRGHVQSPMNIERIMIDSIHQINLYKISKKVVAAEYCTFEQVIKVGIIDTSAVSLYLTYKPNVGNDLFIYNCASCHYASLSFSDSINVNIPTDKNQLKSILCGTKHVLADPQLCKALNDFEIFLLLKYLNEY